MNVFKFVIPLLVLCSIPVSAINEDAVDFIKLLEKKKLSTASGDIQFSSFEGSVDEETAKQLIEAASQLGISEKASTLREKLENLCDQASIVEHDLKFNGENYNSYQKSRPEKYEKKVREIFDIKDGDVIYHAAARINETFSYDSSFEKFVHINRPEIPPTYPIDDLVSLDLTRVNFQNLLIPVPSRTVDITKKENTLNIRTSMTKNGYEQQTYEIVDNIPYSSSVEGLMGKTGMKVNMFYRGYKPVAGAEILFPNVVLQVTQPLDGVATFKAYVVSKVSFHPVEDKELILDIPDDKEIQAD